MKVVQNTKKLISDNDYYRVYAELCELDGEVQTYNLKFKTVWLNAKEPEAEQFKFEMFLNQEQLNKLKELL